MIQQILLLLRVLLSRIMTITLLDILDYLGTFAFAISGLRLASAKQFDWFGAFIVGLVTAVGGGTLRDLMLDRSPFWMTQWPYLAVSGLALALFVVLRKQINRVSNTIFLFDTIGLGLFTVVGIQRTLDAGFPLWTAIAMGMITGAAGGVLRDILINEVPLIFRRDIYALACLVGGLFYAFGYYQNLPAEACAIGCAMAVIIIRLLAVMFHWQLPILHDNDK